MSPLDQEDGRAGPVLGDNRQMGAQRLAEPGAVSGVTAGDRFDRRREDPRCRTDNLEEDLLLVGHMRVETALQHADPLGYVLHGRAVITANGEQFRRFQHNLLTPRPRRWAVSPIWVVQQTLVWLHDRSIRAVPQLEQPMAGTGAPPGIRNQEPGR